MRLLLGLAAIVGFGAFAWFLVHMGRLLERGATDRDVLTRNGVTKDSRDNLNAAAGIMNSLLFFNDLDNPNLINDTTKTKLNDWLNDYKKEITK